jgi:hypothetical protein
MDVGFRIKTGTSTGREWPDGTMTAYAVDLTQRS